jgi:hypothetical protein
MKKSWIKKASVLGMIMLFVSAGLASAINVDIKNPTIENKKYITEIAERQTYQGQNIIGELNILLTKEAPEFEWWVAEDRNFTYPIINGNVKVNYTFVLKIKPGDIFLAPWATALALWLYRQSDGEFLAGDIGLDVRLWKPEEGRTKYIPGESYSFPASPSEDNEFIAPLVVGCIQLPFIIKIILRKPEYVSWNSIPFWASYVEA